MKRWRVSDGNDNPVYVECETLDGVIPLYRKQWKEDLDRRKNNPADAWWWEEYGVWKKPPADKDLHIKEVGREELKWGPRPTCCARINEIGRYSYDKGLPIQLRTHKINPDPDKWEDVLDPHWKTMAGDEVFFCPFCGSKLPEVEKMENPPQPLWNGDDDYCGTCNERNRACECNPPWAAYRIVE